MCSVWAPFLFLLIFPSLLGRFGSQGSGGQLFLNYMKGLQTLYAKAVQRTSRAS